MPLVPIGDNDAAYNLIIIQLRIYHISIYIISTIKKQMYRYQVADTGTWYQCSDQRSRLSVVPE